MGDCPFCQDRRHHLHVNLDKGVYHCFRCGASGRIKDGKESQARSLPLALPAREPASIEVLDRAYRALLSVLVLSGEHREHLLSRGLSAAQVAALGYRTMPKAGRTHISARVTAVAGEVAGVPGFYLYKEGVWCLAGPPGILVPVRDFEGRVHGAQIRRTGEIEGPRYVWLSSQGDDRRPRVGGTPAKATYHVARAGSTPGRVWITEGPIKADISAMLLGEAVIAVPGVNAWEGSGLLDALKKHSVAEATIAFDADLAANKWVARSAWKLHRALRRAGITTQFAAWSLEDGKGLDDLLVAGKKPKVLSAPVWREKHAALLGRRKEDRMNRVILAGRLAAKPTVEQGKKALHARLQVVEERDGDIQREQTPIPVHAWRETAEKVAGMGLDEGDFVFIEGYIGFGYMTDDAGNHLRPIQINALNIHRVGALGSVGTDSADHVADEGGIEIPW